MAARLTKRVKDNHRDSIKTSMLLNRLQNHVLGKLELSNSQVRAAAYLINQAIGAAPQTIEHSGTVTLEGLIAQSMGISAQAEAEESHVTH
jgi:hypothetical protein